MSLVAQIGVPLLVFLAATGLAAAVGANGLGVAATVGVIAFAATLVAVLVRGAPPRA